MCGLFGWDWKPGKMPNKQMREKISQILSEEMDERGGQSWGAWSPDLVLRGMGKCSEKSQHFVGMATMFGHSRWATHGTNALENTHPFTKAGVVLAHNGVLSNHRELNAANQREHVVDSEHILSHLVEAKPFTELQGYGTVCFAMPGMPGAVYMGRLDERGPLCVVLTERGVLWASTEHAVKKAVAAAGLTIENQYPIVPGKAYYSDDGELFEDVDFPSIRIAEAPAARDWRSYSTGSTGFQMGTSSYVYWCNEHLKPYTKCTCRGTGHAHIVNIKPGDNPVEGQPYSPSITPAPTAPSPVTPVHSDFRGTPEYVSAFCPASQCYQKRNECTMHPVNRGSVPGPEQVSLSLGDVTGPVTEALAHINDREIFDVWAEEMGMMEEQSAQNVAIKALVYDLAELWLETAKGITPAMTCGMTQEDKLGMAMEEGFDAAEAELEATQDLTGVPYDLGNEVQEAGVHVAEVGNEPSHRRAARAVAGGSGD